MRHVCLAIGVLIAVCSAEAQGNEQGKAPAFLQQGYLRTQAKLRAKTAPSTVQALLAPKPPVMPPKQAPAYRPQVAPQAALQPAPQVAPQAALQPAPQVAPLPAPQALPGPRAIWQHSSTILVLGTALGRNGSSRAVRISSTQISSTQIRRTRATGMVEASNQRTVHDPGEDQAHRCRGPGPEQRVENPVATSQGAPAGSRAAVQASTLQRLQLQFELLQMAESPSQ